MQNSTEKGFTLIELLVVIAIIAILAVVVILTLNPAELLRQARDSNRISDMNTLKSAIGVYMADVTTGMSLGTSGTCYLSASSSATLTNCGFTGTYTISSSSSRKVDSTGWVPVNFNAISSGSPIGQEPIDPINTGVNVYRYVASTTSNTFELLASCESAKYTNATNGTCAMSGNASTTLYQTGTSITL